MKAVQHLTCTNCGSDNSESFHINGSFTTCNRCQYLYRKAPCSVHGCCSPATSRIGLGPFEPARLMCDSHAAAWEEVEGGNGNGA